MKPCTTHSPRLPNRSFLYNALERSLARLERSPDIASPCCSWILDRFKVINDSVGHLAGDQMLKEAVARLAACVRPFDVVARLGGDEFAVLLEDVNLPEGSLPRCQRAIASCRAMRHRRQGAVHFGGVSASPWGTRAIAGRRKYFGMPTSPCTAPRRTVASDSRSSTSALHEEALQLLEMESGPSPRHPALRVRAAFPADRAL
jgi:diguanylate cyclase (GGDEF)-like protein